MCGISGCFDPGFRFPLTEKTVEAMSYALRHRGPDSSGIWLDHQVGLGLGHRRLSIIDLSPAGHQPMVSMSGRFVIVLNGEVYNFKEIRKQLEHEGAQLKEWRGHSDTEVILAAIEEWGLLNALDHFVGMFAFVLWDRQERTLHLVRDRFGEKPLYYGWQKGVLLFGSELKAMKAHPAFDGEINRDALALLLRHNYIPAPYCIYKGIFKLKPGTILSVSRSTKEETLPTPYWDTRKMVEDSIMNQFTISDEDAVAQLDIVLRDAVKSQMVSDVPLGAFLSGGVDSSTMVALMQAQSVQPVKTFTIGFDEKKYNEAEQAKAVARHLGTDHLEIYVTSENALAVIPKLPTIYDEPFSDSSQIPTFLISQFAKQNVTVSLSGDAGDELFGGYDRYFFGTDIWNKVRWMPKSLRRGLVAVIGSLPTKLVDSAFGWVGSALENYGQQGSSSEKLKKVSTVLGLTDSQEFYRRLVSQWNEPSSIVLGGYEPPTYLNEVAYGRAVRNFPQQMMFLDLISYLPEDILVKVDRAAMAVGLETRIPLLDYRVVEFVWKLPLHMKMRRGESKWLLRKVLEQYVPKEMTQRPKMGFGVPIDVWLRGPLRDWAESLLNESRMRTEGFFQTEPIREKWCQHLSGTHDWNYYLWDVLMFEAWLEHQKQQ